MKNYLVFDTETTGLPKTGEISYAKLDLWPHPVQLSYAIYNKDSDEVVKVRDYLLKLPDHMKINAESIKIHGITDEMLQRKGVNFEEIVEELAEDFQGADCLIAHNINFDMNILKTTLMRYLLRIKDSSENMVVTRSVEKRKKVMGDFLTSLLDEKNSIPQFCTMKESIQLCRIVKVNKFGYRYLKFPKLIELHKFLFQCEPRNLHNALNDILICLRCFCKLKYDYDIVDKNIKIKKMIEPLL
jgi:DNA polymerase III epsilon subunit-like protein